MRRMLLCLVCACLLGSSPVARAADGAPMDCSRSNRPEAPYSPYVGKDFPKNVYFGDTHVHTSYSFDAGVILSLGPIDAYRLARGEELVSPYSNQPVKLVRPLDFLVVADHAEYLGIVPMVLKEDPRLMEEPSARRWSELLKEGSFESRYKAYRELLSSFDERNELIKNPDIKESAWGQILDAAETFNAPGRFTTFAGFEWTSNPGGNNLHRVVIFEDGPDKTSRIVPFSLFDSEDPEQLWKYLEGYETQTGGKVLAIPHNGNLSNGLMFSDKDFNGQPLTRAYAESRARWEPIAEVTQIKGDGETHPLLSPTDEFADFERWDKANLTGSAPKDEGMLRYEYARSALRLGLELDKKLGANPYKFGMIGSTDTHTALSTAREENYFGKHPGVEPLPCRASVPIVKSQVDDKLSSIGAEMIASGYAGVWARENTRQSLFEAMQRREVYATTGPRMVVRFFGGWEYRAADAQSAFFADIGYTKGVPMGGDLAAAPAGKSPTFLIRAVKDPDGANLDRLQMVKGWLDDEGKSHEKVYDVALSDGRKAVDGKIPAVGNTVNVEDASYTNTIGDPELAAFWTDPDFDPLQRAFYYVRVIEIPTPSWAAYDMKYFHNTMPEKTSLAVQDRAYTSPIWYTP